MRCTSAYFSSLVEGWIIGGSIGLDTSSLTKASANAGFSASYTRTTVTGASQNPHQIAGCFEPERVPTWGHLRNFSRDIAVGSAPHEVCLLTICAGNNAGVSAPCGPDSEGDYTCGLIVRPQCEHIKGTCEHTFGPRIPCKSGYLSAAGCSRRLGRTACSDGKFIGCGCLLTVSPSRGLLSSCCRG